jgi:hypothetical protein
VWDPYGDLRPENITYVWPKTEAALVRETLKAFADNNEVDTLLNAVESPELVTSIRPLYNKLNGVQVLDKQLDRRDIRKLFQNSKRLIGVLSGGFLYYSFGIAPLLSDMRKIARATEKFKSQMERAISKAGTVTSVHRQMQGEFGPIGLVPYAPIGYGVGPLDGYWHTNINSLVKPLMTCTVRGIRTKKFGTPIFNRLSYLIDRFGGTGPASFAYERISFSFVLDWFVDMSGILNRLDNLLTGGAQNVRDVCVSTKYRALCPIIHHNPNASVISIYDGQQTALVELSGYHRKSVQSTSLGGLSGRFGKKQGLLTAALISQMAANLKRKR